MIKEAIATGETVEAAKAVSYTHLDVYKRQALYLVVAVEGPEKWKIKKSPLVSEKNAEKNREIQCG